MFAGLFRSNRPGVLLALLLLVPLLFAPSFNALSLPARPVMPLQQALLHVLGDSGWLRSSMGLLLVMLMGIQLSFLVNSAELMQRRNHLPALFFPLLLAALGGTMPFGPALVGMPFVLFALGRTWSITNMGSAVGSLFDAGLLLGVASLFYLPYAFLVVVVWASTSVIRPFFWRDYVVPVLGSVVAFYIAWAVLRLMDAGQWEPFYTVLEPAISEPALNALRPQRVLLSFLLVGVVGVGVFAYANAYRTGVMREKNLRSSFLAFTAALGVLIVLLWLLSGRFPPVLMAIPLSVFCAYALQGGRRPWLGESAVLALLGLALWAMWGV